MKVYIKKISLIFVIAICASALVFAMAACTDPNIGEKTITLVIGEGDGQKVYASYNTDAAFLIDVMDELVESKELTYTTEESTFGAFLTEINGIAAVSNESYLCILTTVVAVQDSTNWKVERAHDGVTYISAIKGISELEIVDGESYMIVLVSLS